MGHAREAARRAVIETNGDVGEASQRLVQWLQMIRQDREILSAVMEELEQVAPRDPYPESVDALAIDSLVTVAWDTAKAGKIVEERMDRRENPTFYKMVRTDLLEWFARRLQRVFAEELAEWRRQNLGGQ